MLFGMRGVLLAGIVGLILGGLIGLQIQAGRVDNLKSELAFIKAEGVKAQKTADHWKKQSEEIKKENDEKHDNNIDSLRRDIERLRLAARSNILPPSTPAAKSPERACIDRAEFEQAFGRLVTEIQGLVTEGDEGIIGLNTAKVWVREVELSAQPP